ncbi:hypothetical protein [Pseudobacteroides cellulosolvens]|uniref:Uncharacterized protein n=1 Tax=Pseudobacteroides cellulosolvens ATCC 35603 = DSM 2933 TaxID=398512 RepID=A0A0L6JRV4_9FIRM|nr:hypothetical protein [Pseudobacteroides cellulosolvens]KNY28484.1 hypothetical protein Bccel_3758 [Pseudobacteroides cellulosolvens ATCC 35603 = DSM 2933]
MAFKVTIDGGMILEKCIESVSCIANPPSDDIFTTRTKCKNTMTIMGRIGTDEQTIGLYQWALIPPKNIDGYKKVVMEEIKEDKLVRKVCFQKAFVVGYSETFTNSNGVGYFSIDLNEFIGSDIECSSMTDVTAAGNSSNSGSSGSSQKSESIDDSASEGEISSQQTPAPQNLPKSNTTHPPIFKGSETASKDAGKAKLTNLGVSTSGKKLEGKNLAINEKFRGDQFKVQDSFDASIDKARHDQLTSANCRTTCALNENLDGHLSNNDSIKLDDNDKNCLKELANYRQNLSPVKEDTIMQKVIDEDQLNAYLDKDNPKRVMSGCASKASDVAPFTNNVGEAYDNLRLDYKGNKFKEKAENGGSTYVMRCTSNYCPNNSEHPVINAYTQPPCTGTGFLGSEKHLLPEYTYGRGQAINDGAIFKVDKDGNESLHAVWNKIDKRYETVD